MDVKAITGIHESAKISRQNSTTHDVAEFQRHLEQAKNKTRVMDTSLQKTSNLPGPHPVPILNFEYSLTEEMTDKANKAIDLFEKYSQQLNDPSKTLKDIEPTLIGLKNEVDSLDADSTDRELKQIINKLTITANVEYFKFQRGDYV
ncbi:conserved hypothetical protein [Candidatus Magnetomoraceae bacterium gMMP-15]